MSKKGRDYEHNLASNVAELTDGELTPLGGGFNGETGWDVDMLIDSPYPVETQERIFYTGHMRNEQAGEALYQLAWPGLRYVVCYHMSEKANRDDLAVYEAYSNVRHEAPDCEVVCARQAEISRLMTVM